ncbi:MAG: DNA mismatch repair protein MutS, partial [bacterium]|nr:DNA mismatch repair protein MutS [bacterium]
EQLVRPLIFVSEIEKRLETVGELKANRVGREKLREGLTRIRDIERLAGKIALQNVTPRDLIMLKESCRPLATLQETIRSFSSPLLRELTDKWDLLSDLKEAIEETLVEEPPLSIKEGGILRPEVSPELAELREMIHGGKESLLKMESRERERSGISSLKIKFNRVFGYYIEITNTHLDKIPENYIRKQTLVNAERFITPELKEYETKVLSAKERISQLEYQLFVEFREKLLCFVAPLQEQARRIAWLDFFSSLAEAAFQFNYNRPQISEEKLIRIHEGRHPVIERLNPQEPFFPNDILLDGDQNRFLIITGPNMSGKSTIMRQTAIIVLMAQLGSFVPATEATVGIVDKLFTRVGARDDLSRGASTFMVEMQEASKILHQATDRSLILLDEIGRGTSTFDGISIAWAMSEEIHNHLRARTLFATHYHELTDLALTCSGVKNYNVAVKLEGDDVLFLRKLVAGGASRSYGIAVAKMAGLPPAVLKRANEVLKNLEKKD